MKWLLSIFFFLTLPGLSNAQYEPFGGGEGDGFAEDLYGTGMMYQYPSIFSGGIDDGFGEGQLGTGEQYVYPSMYAGSMGDGFAEGKSGDGTGYQYPALYGGGDGDGTDPENFGDGSIYRYPSMYGGGLSDGYTASDLDCNFNLEVSNTLLAGTGSLGWALACVVGGDTVKLMPVLAQDTIWVEDQLMHLEKSCMISGMGADLVTIATHQASPFVRIASGTTFLFEHFRLVENGTNGRLIDIHGDLTLRDMQLVQGQGANVEALYLHPGGNLHLEMQNTLVK